MIVIGITILYTDIKLHAIHMTITCNPLGREAPQSLARQHSPSVTVPCASPPHSENATSSRVELRYKHIYCDTHRGGAVGVAYTSWLMFSFITVSFCRSWREWAGEREMAGELPIPELTTGSTKTVSEPELLQIRKPSPTQYLVASQPYLRGKNLDSSSGSILS